MVSLCAKRLIRINNVLDHMLQKAKQVVEDHCFLLYFFIKKPNCLVCVCVFSNPLGFFLRRAILNGLAQIS